jgi:hypothetical protein
MPGEESFDAAITRLEQYACTEIGLSEQDARATVSAYATDLESFKRWLLSQRPTGGGWRGHNPYAKG